MYYAYKIGSLKNYVLSFGIKFKVLGSSCKSQNVKYEVFT